jgi:putative ABC transport system permease protein
MLETVAAILLAAVIVETATIWLLVREAEEQAPQRARRGWLYEPGETIPGVTLAPRWRVERPLESAPDDTLILGETVLVAAIATALAVLPAHLLGEFLFGRLLDSGVVTDGTVYQMGWFSTVVGIGSALVAAVGGAAAAGGRAAKTRPVEALATAGLPASRPITVRRFLFGLVLLAGGIALLVATMTINSGQLASGTGSPAALLLAIALAALSPVLIHPLLAMLHPLVALAGQSGRLAMLNLRSGIDRTAAVAMPVIVLTGIATGLLYMHTTGKHHVHQEFVDGLAGDAVITADHVNADLAERVAGLPGVAVASEYARSRGYVEEPFDDPQSREGSGRWHGWTLEGTTPQGVEAVLPAPVTEGGMDGLHGASVALDSANAAEIGVGVGDEMTLRMGDGTVLDVEVVALYDARPEDDTLLLPVDLLAVHTTEGRPTEILVAGDGDIDTERLVADIEKLLADEDGATVADSATLSEEYAEEQDSEAFAIYLIVGLIIAYSAISLINALASSTNARRREFGLQRLTGSTRGQVLRMLCVEGLVTAMIGVVLGTVSAAAALVAYGIGRADAALPIGPAALYPTIVVLTLLLTLLATLIPARGALRQRPVEAATE